MRYFLFAAILITTTGSASTQSVSAPVTVTLSEVVSKVSTENYNVYSNALRVYQARESIQVARMNLLPRLNLWRLAGASADLILGGTGGASVGSSVLGLIEDIAPFLVPANWFRVTQSKLLYLADLEGYRALWANQVMSAKALYLHLLLDRTLLETAQRSQSELRDLIPIVKSRELLGGAPQGASRDLEVRQLSLQEDQRSLEALISEEQGLLAFSLGYPADVVVMPANVGMPAFETLQPLDYQEFEYRALSSAPEIRQFDHFVAAADSVRSEVMYSFLGVSDMSRGVAGGIFDGLPVQSGLGFGTAGSMRIVSAQKEILKVQKAGAEETVKRYLRLLVNNYNLDLENYSNLKRREDLVRLTNEQLYERLRLGQDVDTLDLIEASRNHIQAETAFLAVQFRFLANEDRLARIIFHGDYTKEPVLIEELKKGLKP